MISKQFNKTSSKWSPPFCLLTGHKNTKVFWHQSEARRAATVWNWSGIKDIVPRGSSRHSLHFFMPYIPAHLDFSSPPLPAPGSPRMMHDSLKSKMNQLPNRLGSIKNLDYSLLSINLAGSCVLCTVGTCQPNPRQHSVNKSAASQLRHQLTLRQ